MNKIMNADEMKAVCLNILIEVDKFCKENKLTYFLGYGSLLGAIRHNGYIPWDDDVDIVMPRNDYMFFINNFHSKYYDVCSCYKNKKYVYSFAKAYDTRTLKIEQINQASENSLGVDIDIFPLDLYYSEDSYKRMQRKWKRLKRVWLLNILKASNQKNIFKKIIILIGRLIFKKNPNKLAVKMDNLVQSDSGGRLPLGYLTMACIDERACKYSVSWFNKISQHEFEGHLFNIPSDFDLVLKTLYGNYMEFPPLEERCTHHNFVAYWK